MPPLYWFRKGREIVNGQIHEELRRIFISRKIAIAKQWGINQGATHTRDYSSGSSRITIAFLPAHSLGTKARPECPPLLIVTSFAP